MLILVNFILISVDFGKYVQLTQNMHGPPFYMSKLILILSLYYTTITGIRGNVPYVA